MARRLRKGAAALALLALIAVFAVQGTMARTLLDAPAPAPAAEEPGSGVAPAPAPALNLTVDDGAALLGQSAYDRECKGLPTCECGLADGTGACEARCQELAYDFADWGLYEYYDYLNECGERCTERYEFCNTAIYYSDR